jgi:hypothetical protein
MMSVDSKATLELATDLDSSAQEKQALSEADQHDPSLGEGGKRANGENNIIDWDGPEDPQNPRNWPVWKRMTQVILASAFLLTANLAATMFAPGAASLATEFKITNSTVTSLTVSIYLCGFAVGPMVIAPLSELYGRIVIYHTCNVFYIGFIIGCALAKNTGMILGFRILAGLAASGPLTVGGGTVADVIPPEHRGKVMSLFFLGPLLGPVSGFAVCKSFPILIIFPGLGPHHRWLRVRIDRLALDLLDHHYSCEHC